MWSAISLIEKKNSEKNESHILLTLAFYIKFLLTNVEEQSPPYILNECEKMQKFVSVYTTGINNITLLRNQHK